MPAADLGLVNVVLAISFGVFRVLFCFMVAGDFLDFGGLV